MAAYTEGRILKRTSSRGIAPPPSSFRVRCALFTGPIGAGKSTAAARTAELARRQGLTVAGLWCPALLRDGVKVGIEAVDLAGGGRRLLAVRNSPAAEGRASPEAGRCARTGRYTFVPDSLAWAGRVLADAVAARPDLLVVDEIGPLELERGEGLAGVLEDLAGARVPCALVVVRDRLVREFQTRLPLADTSVFPVDDHTRGSAPERALGWLFRAPGSS